MITLVNVYALVQHFTIIYNGIYIAFGVALFLFLLMLCLNTMTESCMWLLLPSSSGVSHSVQHPQG